MKSLSARLFLVIVVLASGAGASFAGTAGAGGYSATFVNVNGTGGKLAVGVTFTYAGAGPVTLTVGTTANPMASKVGQATAAKAGANGTWSMSVGGLNAGTAYTIRLDSPTATYTSPKTYKTMTRKVAVDYKSVWVVDDGDSWPNGCGDFIFVMTLNHAPRRATYGTKCVDSGATTSIVGPPDIGHWVWNDFKENKVRQEFYAWDDDVDCWGANCYSGCSNPRYFDVTCGDMAAGYNNLDLTKEGTRSLLFAATGVGSSVLAIATGTLTVSYS